MTRPMTDWLTDAIKHAANVVFSTLVMAAGLALALPALAQDDRADDRKKLLAMVAAAEAAINSQDPEKFVVLFEADGVITWLNGEVSRGHDAIRAYHRKMVGTATEAILTKYLTKPSVAAPARFYGDVAVAYGSTADEFHPKARHVFRFDSRWTATLLKRGDDWRISALHLSTNVFNNELTAEYQSIITRTGLLTGGGGLLIGGLVAWWFLRKRT